MSNPTSQELVDAFESIEKHDLKVNTIICPDCGNVYSFVNKDFQQPCEHQKKLFEDIKQDLQYQTW
ncbi:MAG: hypothetical protein Q7R33_01030 [Nitrosarchaeum sp.]|nr:hypothetical protein [Nitrosarchaeum sp.]